MHDWVERVPTTKSDPNPIQASFRRCQSTWQVWCFYWRCRGNESHWNPAGSRNTDYHASSNDEEHTPSLQPQRLSRQRKWRASRLVVARRLGECETYTYTTLWWKNTYYFRKRLSVLIPSRSCPKVVDSGQSLWTRRRVVLEFHFGAILCILRASRGPSMRMWLPLANIQSLLSSSRWILTIAKVWTEPDHIAMISPTSRSVLQLALLGQVSINHWIPSFYLC